MRGFKALLFAVAVFAVGFFAARYLNIPHVPQRPGDFLNNQGERAPEGQIPSKDGPEMDHREAPEEDLVKLYPDIIFRNLRTSEKIVAITFDDGPDELYTPKVLDILRQENVKATFFVTGVRGEEFQRVLRDIARDGHVVASHGYLHQKFSAIGPREIINDLNRNHGLIRRVTGVDTKLFRPPYGALDPQSTETIGQEGYKIILWDVDSLDWRSLTADTIIQNVMGAVRPGSIILFHSAGDPRQDLTGTVEALPVIIRELKNKGYRFLTVPELLNLNNYYRP